MDGEWFEVGEATQVLDERGAAIGSLVPGKQYRALEVRDDVIVVGGGGGVRGTVPRSATSLAAPAATQATPAMPPPSAGGAVGGTAAGGAAVGGAVAGGAASGGAGAATFTPEPAPSGSKLPSWLLPGVVGAVLGAAAIVAVFVLTDSGDDGSVATTDTVPLTVETVPVDSVVTSADVTTPATTVAVDTTVVPETTLAPATTAAVETTVPPATPAPTPAPPTTVAPPATPITFVEERAPGPHIAPAPGVSLYFSGPDGLEGYSSTLCPSGNLSLFVDRVDDAGARLNASGYGRVDEFGNGGVYVWFADETGSLIAIDQQGSPHNVAYTADVVTIRGPELNLDLIYRWTWTQETTTQTCDGVNQLVTDLVLPYL